MKEIFEKIFKEYRIEIHNTFAANSLAAYVRKDVPKILFDKLQLDNKQFRITGSTGQGKWAEIPWIGIFDTHITQTATNGYYIVYLFKADMSGVYLSLNQGWTYFKNKYGSKEGKVSIGAVTNSWEKSLVTPLTDFSFGPIKLNNRGNHSDLPRGYELGHICGKYYSADNLPPNSELIRDLRKMLVVYRELKGTMIKDNDGKLSTEKTNDFILNGSKVGIDLKGSIDELDNVIVNSHKSVLTLENPPANIVTRESNNATKGHNANYLKKQINDSKLGLAGEKMVFEFERARLIDEDKKDLANKIEHTSLVKGDGLGYDILSFDTSGNEKYIEVKTTTGSPKTPFYISDNEIQFSKLHSSNYTLYRVYNFDSTKNTASLYIIDGDLSKKINFKPVSYISQDIQFNNND